MKFPGNTLRFVVTRGILAYAAFLNEHDARRWAKAESENHGDDVIEIYNRGDSKGNGAGLIGQYIDGEPTAEFA